MLDMSGVPPPAAGADADAGAGADAGADTDADADTDTDADADTDAGADADTTIRQDPYRKLQVDLTLTPPPSKASLPVDLSLTPPQPFKNPSFIDLSLTPPLAPTPLEVTDGHQRPLAMDFTLTPPPPGQPCRPIDLSLTPPAPQEKSLIMDLTLSPPSYIDLSLSPPNSTKSHIPDSPAAQQTECSNPDADKVSGLATTADERISSSATTADERTSSLATTANECVSGSGTNADAKFLTFSLDKEVEPPHTLTFVTNATHTGNIESFHLTIPTERPDPSDILGSYKLVDIFEEDGVCPFELFHFLYY